MKIFHVKKAICLTRMNVDKFLIFPFYYHVSDAGFEFHGGYAYQQRCCTKLKKVFVILAFPHLESTDELEPRRLAESDSVN